MIDGISIFTKGGIVLWSATYAGVQEDTLNNHVDKLVKEVLIEDRAGGDCIYEDKMERYSMKWRSINSIGLILVVAYEGVLKQLYLNYLLDMLTKEFLSVIDTSVESMKDLQPLKDKEAFRVRVDKVLVKADREVKAMRKKERKNDNNTIPQRKQQHGHTVEESKVSSEEEGGEGDAQHKKKKSGKSGRVWDTGKVTSETMKALDMSKKGVSSTDEDDEEQLMAARRTYLPSEDDEDSVDDITTTDDMAKDDLEEKATSNGIFATLTRQLKNITGNQVLTDDDLQPVLATFREQLMSKNVAMDVANAIADGVANSLVGTRTGQFQSIHATVKEALTQSISRILTPKKSVDVLRAAMQAKANGQVYSIVFLGVNGVGKSTNLSKVAYYLRKKGGLRVLICACDTFRAGAVEQLKTHARCLNVDLFERGYGKDAADIAKQGLYYAKQNAYDVALIDTAGRMQDNEPLMKSLARLVAVNNPDLILFVGEALVGYDAIDQLSKFNRALMDYSLSPGNPRGVDGILLTKYDTVDDKVGAALSMVYITGQPIVFVGTGQKPSGRVSKTTTTEGGVVVIGKKRKAKLNRLLHEGKVSTSELSAEDLQSAKKVPGLQWSCEGVMDEAEIRSKFLRQGVDNKYFNSSKYYYKFVQSTHPDTNGVLVAQILRQLSTTTSQSHYLVPYYNHHYYPIPHCAACDLPPPAAEQVAADPSSRAIIITASLLSDHMWYDNNDGYYYYYDDDDDATAGPVQLFFPSCYNNRSPPIPTATTTSTTTTPSPPLKQQQTENHNIIIMPMPPPWYVQQQQQQPPPQAGITPYPPPGDNNKKKNPAPPIMPPTAVRPHSPSAADAVPLPTTQPTSPQPTVLLTPPSGGAAPTSAPTSLMARPSGTGTTAQLPAVAITHPSEPKFNNIIIYDDDIDEEDEGGGDYSRSSSGSPCDDGDDDDVEYTSAYIYKDPCPPPSPQQQQQASSSSSDCGGDDDEYHHYHSTLNDVRGLIDGIIEERRSRLLLRGGRRRTVTDHHHRQQQQTVVIDETPTVAPPTPITSTSNSTTVVSDNTSNTSGRDGSEDEMEEEEEEAIG
ncbi:hypothetical protein FOZ62_000023, partial [Perkinsus olseni]